MSGYNNRPKKQFYNRPNYGYNNGMPQSRPPLPNPPWHNNLVLNPWLASQETQMQHYENGIDNNFTSRVADPPNISYNNKNNLQNETGTVQHQITINNEQIINENMKAVPLNYNNSHYTPSYRNNNMISYPIPAKYQEPGSNSGKTIESSNKTSKYSLDNRSKNYSSYNKHSTYDSTSRSSQDSSHYRRSNSAESSSFPRRRTHSSSPNRKSSSRCTSSSNSNRNSLSKESTKTISADGSSLRRYGQEKITPITPSKPVTAKIPEKLPKKLNKDTILKLVNSTTRYEPAMQKLLREQRSKLTQNLRNKYNNDTNKDTISANSTFADEEITDGIIPNFTLNLTEDLQFLQEAIDNVDEREAQDAAKLNTKIDCSKTPPEEDKDSEDLILLDEWSATDEKDTEELNSYNNYDLGPLDLPSNIDELQLPSDVSSFFNFTEINKDETTSLINGGGVEEDQDFFNTVKIDENSENVDCNQSTIATTKLSPIKSVLDDSVLNLSEDSIENKKVNDQNENVISEICKKEFSDENYCSPLKVDEIEKNNACLSPYNKNSLRNSENYLSPFKKNSKIENEVQQNYIGDNDKNENVENYISPLKNEEENNEKKNLENFVSPYKTGEENPTNENLENYSSSFKNEIENTSNENRIQNDYEDKKDIIQKLIKEKNDFLSFDQTERSENHDSPLSEEKTAITSLEINNSSLHLEKNLTYPVETNVTTNVCLENQINEEIAQVNNEINFSSTKHKIKSTNKHSAIKKRNNKNKKTIIQKSRKEKIKPIRIKLIKEKNSLKKNLNYFRQIIRAEILNTAVANPYKQQKTRKYSNNFHDEVTEKNIQNNSNINHNTFEKMHVTNDFEKMLLNESHNDNLKNSDSSPIKSEKCLQKKLNIISSEKYSSKIHGTVNSENCLVNIPIIMKSENLENVSDTLPKSSKLISTQFPSDNTNMLSDKLINEDDVSSDNNTENIRLSLSSNENSFGSRKWRSPGEKKFIAASSTNTRPIPSTDNSTNGKEEILLKIYDIDVQIQRLMDEKMNLYKQLMAHSEEYQENVNISKKNVSRKLDLGTEIKVNTTSSSISVASEKVIMNGAIDQQSNNETYNLEERLGTETENGKVYNEVKVETINSDIKQTSKRNKHSDFKSKNLNRISDKENVAKRKTKKPQQESVDRFYPDNVIENVEHLQKIEIKKSQKIEKDEKIEFKKSSPLYEDEHIEKIEIQKSQKHFGQDIELKKSPKKSRRERSSSKKSSSKDKHRKETIRIDACEVKKSSITDHTITKRSVKASLITPCSDTEDKSLKNNNIRVGIRDKEMHKIKNSKPKRDQEYDSESNSDVEDKSSKSISNRAETSDSELRKTKSTKRKRDQEHDRFSNKNRKKRYVLSDSDDGESVIEQQALLPSAINVETIRTHRFSVDTRYKSNEHELPSVKINFDNSIIKPCKVSLVRINPEKYLKNVESKEEIETIDLVSRSEEECIEVKISDSMENKKGVEHLDENITNKSNEQNTIIPFSRVDENKQEKNDEKIVTQTLITSTNYSNNSINNNDVMCNIQKLDYFKCSHHTGSILYVKVYANSLIAGGEDGKIYKYNVNNGELLNSVTAHQAAITSFNIITNKDAVTCIYSGSLDTYFKCFEIETLKELASVQINTAIQCMDADWGYVFIGTVSGYLYRYSINNNSMEDEKHQIGDEAILALKTQNEGGRRILISAPRNEFISIRDAMSGLLLRYIKFTTHMYTIYSIMLSQHGSIVYCGTNKKVILGYNFTDGLLTKELLSGKGIVCLLEYQKLLFAGCYDGFVYVFDVLTNQMVTKFLGPGGMILALEVFDSKVIIGSKNSCLEIRTMPEVVLKYINEHRR